MKICSLGLIFLLIAGVIGGCSEKPSDGFSSWVGSNARQLRKCGIEAKRNGERGLSVSFAFSPTKQCGDFVNELDSLESITSLYFTSVEVPREFLAELKVLRDVRNLDCYGRIASENVFLLTCVPNVEEVVLDGDPLSGEEIPQWRSCITLSFVGGNVSEEGAARLARLPNLRWLTIRGDVSISDKAIELIAASNIEYFAVGASVLKGK